MNFEGRELPPYSEPISANELREGSVYFSVTYVDQELLIPLVDAFVFIGRDLEATDSGQVYFQDVESYQKGARYAEQKGAMQIFVGAENEIGHLFGYEKALEELMRCSLRRQGKVPRRSLETLKAEERFSGGAFEEAVPRSFRFENNELHAAFVDRLGEAALPFEVRSDGAVVFAPSDWLAINKVIHAIRDGCFSWYLSWWNDRPEAAHRFWQEMKLATLPFQVEQHDDALVFLLPRDNVNLHEEISRRVQDGIDLEEASG